MDLRFKNKSRQKSGLIFMLQNVKISAIMCNGDKMKKYNTIDLFAGAGGLSLGFLQTKKFKISVAYEINPDMQETYKNNHKKTVLYDDVTQANYSELVKKYGKFDIVIGGPPCQGFSNANRQKNHAVNMNNMLVKEYMRAVIELQPMAFVMENVSMLKSNVHRFYMDKDDIEIVKKYNIPYNYSEIVLLDKRFNFDGAINIVKDYDLVCNHIWNNKNYYTLNVIYKKSKNKKKLDKLLSDRKKQFISIAKEFNITTFDYISKISQKAFNSILDYYSGLINEDELINTIESAIMIQRMLNKAKEIFDNKIVVEEYKNNEDIVVKIKSFAVYDYLKSILGSEENNYIINSDILCATSFGVPQKRKRFVIIGIKRDICNNFSMPAGNFKEKNFRTVRDAIEDIQDVEPVYSVDKDFGKKLEAKCNLNALAKRLRNSTVLYNHIITKTTPIAMERFKALKQGENFHTLDDSLKATYTDPSRTQNTVYLRLNYDEPSGTVVNVRKSMWIHPVLNRALSVREAARLQTFPDSFRFFGSKDKQYQQVGNAVPPLLANAIAKHLVKLIEK